MNEEEAGKGLSRRGVLKRAVAGAAGLVLSGEQGLWAFPAPAPAPPATPAPAPPATPAPAPPAPPARAKAVIQIWMWGGPSHLDTFDPKPAVGYDYCGPLNTAIPTNADGIQIGQLLPLLAKQADKYSLLRAMTHGVNAHEVASYMVQTGRDPAERIVYPSAGAVVSLFKGYESGYKGAIPPYVVLTAPQGRFSEAGFLGPRYKPFATGGDPNQTHFAVEGIATQGISEERRQSRRELLRSLDSLGNLLPGNPQFALFDRCAEDAERVVAEAAKVFDLSQEGEKMRESYGRNTFGQSCLMARRLVERGVPYVTINYNGWDTHKRHFETMNRKLPEMDQGVARLLQDLGERGLLDSTIVWWGGEFGRTPKVMWESPWNGGRGHYGQCFSAMVAGGGFRGGHVVGASDSRGEEVAQRPVSPQDLLASIYTLLGIAPDCAIPNTKGIEALVMPPGATRHGLLTEIM